MKWITPGRRSECTGTYISRLALFTEPQLLGRGDGEGGWGLNWLGVQRPVSTQIHSEHFCGAQLSPPPAQLPRLSTVPRLHLCTALQNGLLVCAVMRQPNGSQSKTSTAEMEHLSMCIEAGLLLNNTSTSFYRVIPLVTLITMTHYWFNRVKRWNNIETAGREGRGKRRENMRQRDQNKGWEETRV